MDSSFEETLINGSVEQLNDLKRWLFEENIRITIKQKELNDLHEKILKERIQYQEEMKQINLRTVGEQKRLRDEEEFFDKKMEILKSGFMQLDLDRQKLNKERREFEALKAEADNIRRDTVNIDLTGSLFAGVNNPLALKKRYRDLLKIFHPDNLCGDTQMVSVINREYERLKKELDYPFKSVN